MSVKAVRDYFNQICDQYQEMKQDIEEFEQEVANGIIEPERVERMKQQIEPIKQNYMTLSYIMFLLDQPQKPEKHKRYAKQNKKLLEQSKGRQKSDVLAENKRTLDGLKQIVKEQ